MSRKASASCSNDAATSQILAYGGLHDYNTSSIKGSVVFIALVVPQALSL
jgi:hypothetical protein